MNDWKVYGKCHDCGHMELAPLSNINFLNGLSRENVCPKCGLRCPYIKVTARWISYANFFKPWTWCTGVHEELTED